MSSVEWPWLTASSNLTCAVAPATRTSEGDSRERSRMVHGSQHRDCPYVDAERRPAVGEAQLAAAAASRPARAIACDDRLRGRHRRGDAGAADAVAPTDATRADLGPLAERIARGTPGSDVVKHCQTFLVSGPRPRPDCLGDEI